ncbi:MAG TPA: riboflavin biosynthesis protein RibF [Gemmatimonadaceae bacterium]|nr:riboflavin biosynthesis protein RibF [Gemmatimonadaceae bacterium]
MPERGFPQFAGGSVVTIGTFDGVHRGHHQILRDLEARALARALPAAVITFAPHPLMVVNPAAAPHLLTPGDERFAALSSHGAPEYAVLVPFTSRLAALSAEEFVDLLVDRYAMRELVVGYDHGLGRGRRGDVTVLRELGLSRGFSVHVVEARMDAHGNPISATAIRRAVAYGDLDGAREMLGRRYDLVGRVIPGTSRGRGIGIPTINLEIPKEKLLPPDGVYAVRVRGALGTYDGMMNLGGRPTFGEAERVPEVHMFGAAGDWYGASVAVEFVARIRDTVRFSGVEALVQQLGRDAETARIALTQA